MKQEEQPKVLPEYLFVSFQLPTRLKLHIGGLAPDNWVVSYHQLNENNEMVHVYTHAFGRTEQEAKSRMYEKIEQKIKSKILLEEQPKQEAKTAEEIAGQYVDDNFSSKTAQFQETLIGVFISAYNQAKQQYQQELVAKLTNHIRPIVGLVEDYELGIEKAIYIIKYT